MYKEIENNTNFKILSLFYYPNIFLDNCILHKSYRKLIKSFKKFFAFQMCVLSHWVMFNCLQLHGLYSPHDSSDNGIFQARILEWVAMPSSRGSSQPRDPTQVSRSNIWATREALLAFQVGFIFHLNLPITLKHIGYGLRFEWIKFLLSDMCRMWSFA